VGVDVSTDRLTLANVDLRELACEQLGCRCRVDLQPSRVVFSCLVEALNDRTIDREARTSESCSARASD
jgi:hypothetical protein